jgi:phosphonate transport system permease protein
VRSFQYDKAATVTLAVAVLVILSEAVNAAMRRRLS